MRALRADVGPHGQPLSEATDRQNAPSRKGKDENRPRGHYKAVGPQRDYAAEALALAKKEFYRNAGDGYDDSADLWGVEWVPDR